MSGVGKGYDWASFSHNVWKELSHSDAPWKGKPAATGLQTQTSAGNMAVPIVYGRSKIAPNLIWNGDFTANRHKQGKGGGAQGTGQYDYTASLILALCEGPITAVTSVWRELYQKDTGIAFSTKYAAVDFLGTYSQTEWSFMTTAHPAEALAYRGVAYLGLPHYALGTNPQVPSHSVEVSGILVGTGIGNTVDDADPALMIQDFLTNEHYGTSFNPACIDLVSLLSSVDAPTTGDSAYQTYCQAMGFALSPTLSDSDNASKYLENWLTYTNSEVVWSGNLLKFIPYGDEEVTANGVHFIPPTTVRYDLTMDDFCPDQGNDPVTFDRIDPQDAKNAYVLEVLNRDSDYGPLPVGARDQANVESYGLKQADTITAHDIKIIQMGKTVANLMLLRSTYIRNTYSFRTNGNFILLEAMDIVTLTENLLGMNKYPVRITAVKELDDGFLEFEAEDFPNGVSSTSTYTTQAASPTITNQAADPGDVTDYLVFEPPASLAGTSQVWIAATGTGADWGGCDVWVSTDGGTNYYQVGSIQHNVRMGLLTATLATFVPPNPDTTHTLSVNLTESKGELDSGTSTDAANGITLCYVDGELVSYQTSTLTSTFHYDLTQLYRGLYGTTIGAHLSGTKFVRLDDTLFKFDLPADQIGVALRIKLQSFNTFGNGLQDLSGLTPISYTPVGSAFSVLPPTGFTATAISLGTTMSWTASASPIVSGYKVFAVNNHSGAFGSAVLIGTVGPGTTSFTHSGLTAGSLWRYWVVAYNGVNQSSTAGPQDTTTLAGGASSFISLSDVPASYSGAAGKVATVNPGETGLIFSPGGGGGGSVIAGQTAWLGWDTAVGTSQGAFVGSKFTPTVDVLATTILGNFPATVNGAVYKAVVVSVNGSQVIQTILASSASVTNVGTAAKAIQFLFATPFTMTAGVDYVIMIGRTDATNTTAALVGASNGGNDLQWGMPGHTDEAYYELTNVTPTVGQTITRSSSAFRFSMGIQWAVAGSGTSSLSPFWTTPPTPPTTTPFTLVKGGSTTASMSNSTRGVVFSVTRNSSGDRGAQMSQSVPNGAGVPFVMTALFSMPAGILTSDTYAFFVGDATGKVQTWGYGGGSWSDIRWTTLDSFTSGGAAFAANFRPPAPLWMRLTLDATNLTLETSSDGQNWQRVHILAKGAFLGSITLCGIEIMTNPGGSTTVMGSQPVAVHLLSYTCV